MRSRREEVVTVLRELNAAGTAGRGRRRMRNENFADKVSHDDGTEATGLDMILQRLEDLVGRLESALGNEEPVEDEWEDEGEEEWEDEDGGDDMEPIDMDEEEEEIAIEEARRRRLGRRSASYESRPSMGRTPRMRRR